MTTKQHFFLRFHLDKESSDLFNKVLIVVSIISMIIGSIAIYIISSSITKPLLELSDISIKMSSLKFENKYKVKTQDEIGILGNSINNLSDKLEESIGKLKNANIQLKEDLEKKEKLDLMRQEFVANVSHELKTPIALIRGYVEGLEDENILNDENNRLYYISVIKDETERMNAMVYQLLSLSSLENGMADLEIERINLLDIVNGVVKSYELKIEENSIDLNIDINNNIYVSYI